MPRTEQFTVGSVDKAGEDSPSLAVFQPSGGRAPLDPFLACSLRQVVEIRDSAELLLVDDPTGGTLGYLRWRERPIPVLNPVRWGTSQAGESGKQRLVLIRGAQTRKVLAIPIQQFWIEPLDGTGSTELRAVKAARRVWRTQCLALLDAPFGEALLLDVDALFRSLVA